MSIMDTLNIGKHYCFEEGKGKEEEFILHLSSTGEDLPLFRIPVLDDREHVHSRIGNGRVFLLCSPSGRGGWVRRWT